MSDLQLGQKIEARAYLVRKTEADADRNWTHVRKVWRRAVFPVPAPGVLVGLRTLTDGERYWLGGEEGYGYKPTANHRAALVAFSLRETPKLVLLEDIEP